MKTIITLFAITAAFASAETPAKEAAIATKPAEKCCAKDAATPAKTDDKCSNKISGNAIVLSGASASKGAVTVQGGAKDAATPAKTDDKCGTKTSGGTMVVNGKPITLTIQPCDKGCANPAAEAAAAAKPEEKKEGDKK